jgi:nitrogen PTS system EIIA component
MFPPQFLVAERIACDVDISSKKRLLQALAGLLAADLGAITQEAVFEHLIERERLGSTGLGHGIALPHSRMKDVTQARGAFVQLRQGIDYDAIDNHPVDLAFALLVPEEANETHLQLLSALARMFSDASLRLDLHGAKSSDEVLRLFEAWGSAAPPS